MLLLVTLNQVMLFERMSKDAEGEGEGRKLEVLYVRHDECIDCRLSR